MKRLTGALLMLVLFASTAQPQSTKQVMRERHRVLVGWLDTVKAAEAKYRSERGVYGDLSALRDAHMLDRLIFEPETPTATGSARNVVPKSATFDVTAPGGGQHYKVTICEGPEESRLCVGASERSTRFWVGQGRKEGCQ